MNPSTITTSVLINCGVVNKYVVLTACTDQMYSGLNKDFTFYINIKMLM